MQKLIISLSVAFFGFILWMIYLANTGQSSIFFELVASIPYGDKVGHVVLFGSLALFVNASCRFRSFHLRNIPVYWGTAVVWLFVSAEEASQYFVDTRTLDGLDYMADMIGIGLATLLSAQLQRYVEKSGQHESQS